MMSEEAFTRNRVFSKVLKGRKTQQRRATFGTRAVPQGEEEKSKMSNRTQQEKHHRQNRSTTIILFMN